MHMLYELKEKLMQELEEYGSKELTAGSLQTVDTLAHALKNLCKIIEAAEEEGSSERGGSYAGERRSYRGGSYRGGSYMGGSYARGRRNASRDSRGRYSGEDGYSENNETVNSLRSIMDRVNDPQTRQELEYIIGRME